MNRDEISLASLSYQGMIRELLKNWWMIVLAALSMWLLVSGIGKLLYVPQYSVSATLAVSAEGENNTYTSLTMANQMATVIKEIFESDALVSLVKEDVGTTSPASVSCTQVSETNLLVITVSSENPQDAYQFMNSALKHYDDVSDYVFSNAELRYNVGHNAQNTLFKSKESAINDVRERYIQIIAAYKNRNGMI